MKLLICSLAVMALGMFAAGCAEETPAYSANERYGQISRNWHTEAEQMNDDVDSFMLLRPESRLSVWNVYHQN